jgi:hypothetical protein
LKTDVPGRVRTPLARREEILDAFEKSGLSGVAFAALTGVKYPTLANWIRRRRRLTGDSPARPAPEVRFVEAVAGDDALATAPLELELPCGARLRIAGLKQVPLAVALIRGLRPC